MKKLILIGCALLLAGCETPGFLSNKQEFAGINYVEVEFCHKEEQIAVAIAETLRNQGTDLDAGQITAVLQELPVSWAPCGVKIVDGKERSDVDFAFTSPDGFGFEYKAAEEKAFEGQSFRADVAKAQMEVFGEVFPELTDANVDLVNPASALADAVDDE